MDVFSAASPSPSVKIASPAGEGSVADAGGFLGLLAGLSLPTAAPAAGSPTDGEITPEAGAGATMASLLNLMLASPQNTAMPEWQSASVDDAAAASAPMLVEAASIEAVEGQPRASAPTTVSPNLPAPAAVAAPAARLTVTADAPPSTTSGNPGFEPKQAASTLPWQLPGIETPAPAGPGIGIIPSAERAPTTGSPALAPVATTVSTHGEASAGGTGDGDPQEMRGAVAPASAQSAGPETSAFAGLVAHAADPKAQSQTAPAHTTTVKLDGLKDQIAPGEQVAIHLAGRTANGDSHITIQLKPAELGTVDVRIETRQDGEISVHMRVERSETLELLQRDVRHLERALSEAGIKADGSSLSFSLRQEQGQPFADRRWMQHLAADNAVNGNEHPAPAAEGLRPYRMSMMNMDRIDITV